MPCFRTLLLLILVCLAARSAAQAQVTAVAGAAWSFPAGPMPARDAPLGWVQGVALDAGGNVYAADHGNCIVVKINPAGLLTVVAGNGRCGFSGDGGPATQASLRLDQPDTQSDPLYQRLWPAGLAVDVLGSLYIADTSNHRVRKVTPDGIIRTIAGTGQTTEVRDSVPATSTFLRAPLDVVLDASGSIYIATGGRVRRVNAAGIISTLYTSISDTPDPVHTRPFTIRAPAAVEVDAAGNVYFVEVSFPSYGVGFQAGRIYRLEPDGRATLVAGGGLQSSDGGPATQASLPYVSGIALDRMGNLYVADQSNHRVRKIGRDGIITTVAGIGRAGFSGDGPATANMLRYPTDVAVDATGNLFIADQVNLRVRRVSADGAMTTIAGNGNFRFAGDGGPAVQAVLHQPAALAFDGAGNLYIADAMNQRIRKVTPDGIIKTIAGNGRDDSDGDDGPAEQASLSLARFPGQSGTSIAADAAGNVYVAERPSGRIRRIGADGVIRAVAGSGAYGCSPDGVPAVSAAMSAWDVAVDPLGRLHFVDGPCYAVRTIDADGALRTVAGALTIRPRWLDFDALGNLYVADTYTIQRVGTDGVVRTIADVFGVTHPGTRGLAISDMAVDRAGNIYVTGPGFSNRQIIWLSQSGSYRVLGECCEFFRWPFGLAVDNRGSLYFVDLGTERVRRLPVSVPAGVPEPELRISVPPDFYIAEVHLAPGEREGYWAMSVDVPSGLLAGEVYFGGAIQDATKPPAFLAFSLAQPGTVRIAISAQVIPPGDPTLVALSVRLLDGGRNQIGTDEYGRDSVYLERSLGEGFYIVEVRGGAGMPRASMWGAVAADAPRYAIFAGSFLIPGVPGYVALYVPEQQEISLRVSGAPTLRQDGAGNMELRLLDGNRNVIGRVP